MKDQARDVYRELLEVIYTQMEDDEECALGEYEIITNILQEGAAILRPLAPGLRIMVHKYSTLPRFDLTVMSQQEDPQEEEPLGEIIGPTIPQGESEDDVTNIIRQIRTKLKTNQ